ncbi:MAG: hypothetical protein K9K82_13485 [Desulfobacteraceae bacterium]|nr:hypothetical protein [Desulfobacteraceae bacterium]
MLEIHLKTLPRKSFFCSLVGIALRCPEGGAEKRVSERKLRRKEAPGARKLLFRAADQPRCLQICLSAKIPPWRDKQFFTRLSILDRKTGENRITSPFGPTAEKAISYHSFHHPSHQPQGYSRRLFYGPAACISICPNITTPEEKDAGVRRAAGILRKYVLEDWKFQDN